MYLDNAVRDVKLAAEGGEEDDELQTKKKNIARTNPKKKGGEGGKQRQETQTKKNNNTQERTSKTMTRLTTSRYIGESLKSGGWGLGKRVQWSLKVVWLHKKIGKLPQSSTPMLLSMLAVCVLVCAKLDCMLAKER